MARYYDAALERARDIAASFAAEPVSLAGGMR
jgi:hypothetical protein